MRKILVFGLPIYMYVMEVLLKTMASITSESLFGITLAGAGIGFLLPLTELKRIQVTGRAGEFLQSVHLEAYSVKDKRVVDVAWVAFLSSLLAWIYALFLTFKHSNAGGSVWPTVIGGGIFVCAVVLSEIKERA